MNDASPPGNKSRLADGEPAKFHSRDSYPCYLGLVMNSWLSTVASSLAFILGPGNRQNRTDLYEFIIKSGEYMTYVRIF